MAVDPSCPDALMLLAPMCQAAVVGDIEHTRALIAQRADVNLATPHDQRTVLHVCAAAGHLDLVKFLVEEASAELQRDRNGMLPVHEAKQNGHAEVRNYLQEIEVKSTKLALGDETFAKQMDNVFGLVVRDGIFSYHTAQAEVLYYYGTLGMHPIYFEHFTAAQISRHIQCLLAAKKVSETRSERELQFSIEDERTGFFLATLSPSPRHRETVQQCHDYLLETVRRREAYSLSFMASEGPAFVKGASAERLGIYVVDRTHWEPLQGAAWGGSGGGDSELFEETDLQRIATTRFLKKESPESLALHQRLVERAVNTRSMAVEVVPGSRFPNGMYEGGHVLLFSVYEVGGHEAEPLLTNMHELLCASGMQPKCYDVDVFSNGAASYALYFSDASEAMVQELKVAMRYVQHMKNSTIESQRLWNEVMGSTITPEQSIYLRAGCKFCYAFFPRERYVPQYAELQKMLHEPENKRKLDELYLQTIKEIITTDRIYEIVCRHISFAPRFFADFQQIAAGDVKPFWNEELSSEIDEHVRDPFAVQVLRMFLKLNQCLLITNFLRNDEAPAAVAMRFDPEVLLAGRPKSLYPDVPFGIYMVFGRTFHGFHVRFREIARGGVRVVRSRDAAMYHRNNAALFEECYNLAFTQQLKNKDIPEGGAKGVILLDDEDTGAHAQSASAGRDCFVKYTDALLDCMLRPAGVASHCMNDELLFFGPDEGTADCMDLGARRARDRGHKYWKALTTGKSVQLGGVPHDVYGITTRGVRTYVRELYRELGLDETQITKLQTGGPDGDLGSNEILQSMDKTVALLDAGAIAYDPSGLARSELERLARARQQISCFNRAHLGPGGFLVLVGDENIVLPDGSRWRSGIELRDRFVFTDFARADLFVPCGGRPATVNAANVGALLAKGAPWKMVVEGANLFFTDEARRQLETAGVHLFKDSSANKGGVTSSSLEVLASLALPPQEHDRLLTAAGDEADLPEFYSEYVKAIIERIEDNCKSEFQVIWDASKVGGPSAMKKIDASKKLSQEITQLQDHIAAAELDDELVKEVLAQAIPDLLVKHCGINVLYDRLPPAYVKATIAFWLASKYVYEHGVAGSNSFAFHRFMQRCSMQGTKGLER